MTDRPRRGRPGDDFDDDLWTELMARVGKLARENGDRLVITEAPDGRLLYSLEDGDETPP